MDIATARRSAALAFIRAAASVAMILGAIDPTLAADGAPGKTALVDDWSRSQLFELMGSYILAQAPPSDIALFAFRANFRFPHNAEFKNPVLDEDPRMDQTFGIDVSHHNTANCHCKLDWAALAGQKVSFAYLKATQGNDYYDDKFDAYLAGIRALPSDKKIEVGAYHFLSADGTAEDQAANYIAAIEGKLGPDDLTPSLDLEWDVRTSHSKTIVGPDGKPKDFWDGTDRMEILAKTLKWLDVVEKATHQTPVVYTNAVWWKERIGPIGSMQKALGHYPIWISDLSAKGLEVEQPYIYKGGWYMWQFTFTARPEKGGLPPGGSVDADVFAGDMAKLKGHSN